MTRNEINDGSLVDGPSVNDGSPIAYDIRLSRKEILPAGGSKIHPARPNVAAKINGPRMEAIKGASKIGLTDRQLNDGPAIRGPFGVNSNGGPTVSNHGHDVQNSKKLGGEAKKGVNSWASLFGSTSGFSMTYTLIELSHAQRKKNRISTLIATINM